MNYSELKSLLKHNPVEIAGTDELVIRVVSPGRLGPSPSVAVADISVGFDWDAGTFIIEPAQPLTTLTPEQLADITASVRKGQSWHAFQSYKALRSELDGVTAQRDELLALLERLSEAKPGGCYFLKWDTEIRTAIAKVKGGGA